MNLLSGKITGTGEKTTVNLDGGGQAVSAVPTMDSDMGRNVNIGVRPEDFVETEQGGIYQGKVDITEALGEVTLLYFESETQDGSGYIAKLPGIHANLRGQMVSVTAEPEKVHLFADGESLLYRD